MAKKHRKDRAAASTAGAAGAAPGNRFPAWLVWPVAGAWIFFVLKSYYARSPLNLGYLAAMLAPGQYAEGLLRVLPGHLLSLAAAAFFFFACFALGRAALRAEGLSFAGALEEISLSCGAGLGLLAAYVFALSALKLLYLGPVAAFLALAAAGGVYQLRTDPLARGEGAGSAGALGPVDLAALGALLLALLLNLAGALGPEIFYDALVYHLAVPNYYVLHHGFAPMPYNFYSNLPFTHGMLYAAGLLLKGSALTKLINYGAGIVTVLAVLAFGARHFSLRAGLWAALIFYTVAHAMFASWAAGTEALLTLFSTLALYAVLTRGDGADRRLWLAACFCGLAMGVKYTGIFTSAGVMLLYAWSDRARPAAAARNLALFTLLAAVFTGPWLVKNWLYTGNPVFPFALKLFGAGATADPQKLSEFAVHAAQIGPFSPKGWLLTHWKVTMGQVPNSEYFTPLFLALLPVLFLLSAPAGPALAGLWIFFLAWWLGWSVSSTMVRFLMPAYPAAGLLIAGCLFSPGHRALKLALRAVVLGVCLGSLYISALLFYTQGRWRPVAGAIPAEEYLAHTQPTYPYSCYAAIKFINEQTGPGSKTLMIGDEKSFYFKKDFIVSSVYDRTAAAEYAAAAKDGADLYARLRGDGVTHLLVNTADAIRLGREYRMFYWDARARAAFDEFWGAHARSVFAFEDAQNGRVFNRVEVYELLDRLPPGTPPAFNPVKEIIMKSLEAR
jgi:4-amino-4-deoxy-L-arabinose transferase-like glycosyltransferase